MSISSPLEARRAKQQSKAHSGEFNRVCWPARYEMRATLALNSSGDSTPQQVPQPDQFFQLQYPRH